MDFGVQNPMLAILMDSPASGWRVGETTKMEPPSNIDTTVTHRHAPHFAACLKALFFRPVTMRDGGDGHLRGAFPPSRVIKIQGDFSSAVGADVGVPDMIIGI